MVNVSRIRQHRIDSFTDGKKQYRWVQLKSLENLIQSKVILAASHPRRWKQQQNRKKMRENQQEAGTAVRVHSTILTQEV